MSKEKQYKENESQEELAVQEVNASAEQDAAIEKDVQKKEKKIRSVGTQVLKFVTAAVVALVLFWFGFTTVVREGSCAVILRFGAVREEVTEAGLYFKLPWPFESVVSYDNRVQVLEGNVLETTTKDKRNIQLTSYVVWRIDDPDLFHNRVGAKGSVNAFIHDQVFSATNSTMGTYPLTGLVSLNAEEIKIEEIQDKIFQSVHDVCLENYGIEIIDVSFLRITLPGTNLDTVFEQMRADRESEIDEILAKANAAADKTLNDADKEATEKENEGVIEAAGIRADMEKEVAKIYADAQSANIELYQFLKNLDTVVSSINSNTVLIVKANEYPFNILFDYADIANEDTVLYDLSYILTQLPEQQRTDLINAIAALIEDVSNGDGFYTAALMQGNLLGASAIIDNWNKIAPSDSVTVTISPDKGMVFKVAPIVTVQGATAGNLTVDENGIYTCVIYGFTSSATITITGTAEAVAPANP